MKNSIILIVFLFSFVQKSNAQFTTPMPDTTANWTILSTFIDWTSSEWHHTRSILIGSTQINGYTYFKITGAEDINDTSIYNYPLYRIDSNRVYFLNNDSTERLEYDFGMQIGDSILLSDGVTYGTLLNIDTIVIFSGQEITRFDFGNGTDWYYGIGSSAGFENYEYCECAISLTSFYYNNECYIFYPSYDSSLCYSSNLLDVDESVSNGFEFSIYPNPSNGKINIVVVNANTTSYEILDLNGQIIYSGRLNDIHSEIELNISGGVYLIKFENELGFSFQKLIIQE